MAQGHGHTGGHEPKPAQHKPHHEKHEKQQKHGQHPGGTTPNALEKAVQGHSHGEKQHAEKRLHPEKQHADKQTGATPSAFDKGLREQQHHRPQHAEKPQLDDKQKHTEQQAREATPNAFDKRVREQHQQDGRKSDLVSSKHDQAFSSKESEVGNTHGDAYWTHQMEKMIRESPRLGSTAKEHMLFDIELSKGVNQSDRHIDLTSLASRAEGHVLPTAPDKQDTEDKSLLGPQPQPQEKPEQHEKRYSGTTPNILDKKVREQQTGLGDMKNSMTVAHARGEMGERDAAFALGKMGLEVIIGPGGDQGHQLTTRGIDQLAFDPKTGDLWIIDNKATGRTDKIRDASAITRNLETNLETAYEHVKNLEVFPHKDIVLQKLEATMSAVISNKSIPNDVKLVITNAGGYSTGVGKDLAAKGVAFVDVVGSRTIEARRQEIKAAEVAGLKPNAPISDLKVDKAEVPPHQQLVEPFIQQTHVTKSIEAGAQLIQEAQVQGLHQNILEQAQAELESRLPFIETLRQQGQFVVVSMVLEVPKQIDALQGLGGPRQIPVYKGLMVTNGRTEEEALHPTPTIGALSPEARRVRLPKGPDEDHRWVIEKIATFKPD